MAEQMLPLFPLQVVLFPHSILPLHIFEERYKQLVGECLEEREREFGINLVTDQGLARVGCTAVVADVLKRYSDGRLDILVEGRRRFELARLMSGPAAYSVGHIRWLNDIEEDVDVELARETVQLHNQLVDMVYRQSQFKLEYDPTGGGLSFRIAQKAGMEMSQRQRLLEMNSENERLRFLQEYFLGVIPKLERMEEVERIIKSDGYIIQ